MIRFRTESGIKLSQDEEKDADVEVNWGGYLDLTCMDYHGF